MALGLKDAIESAHMGHPDFRVVGRIFATRHADMEYGMVALTPEQQQQFDALDEDTLGEALTLAWQRTVDKYAKGATTKAARA